MNGGIKSQVAKSAKTLAKQAAKQIAREPIEVVKAGAQQVAGVEIPSSQPIHTQPPPTQPSVGKPDIEALKREDQARSSQLREKLEREIKEIGEKESQKEILRTQVRAPAPAQPQIKPLVEPAPKRSRRLFSFGPKTAAERKKTRVERVQPPTG
jgi:hypothetical protein